MNSTVLLKRGIKADLPDRLPLGEVVFCTDTSELYVGMGDNEPPKKASANVSAEEIGDIANLETDYRSTIVGAINELNKKIRYLEENGAIGGNNSAPILSSDHSKYTYTTDEEINIPYYVVDAEGGKMTATYIVNGATTTEEINIGYNTLKLGKVDKGTYDIRMFVKDRGGLLSNELRFLLTVGSLELTSIFDPTNDGNDFEFGDTIEITYFIANVEDEPVDVDLTIDDVLIKTETVRPGTNKVTLPQLQIGNHTIKLRGFNGKVYSNTLEYIITVTNSSSLLLSTTFDPQSNLTVSDRVVIPFRISLKDGKKFKVYRTHTYKNTTTELPTMTGYLGLNTWDLGYLGTGSHHITIRATTDDGEIESINTIDLTFNIASSNFTPITSIKDETLMLELTCKNKSNHQEDRNIWSDTSGNQVQTTLHNFNYVNNGWFEDYLHINGEAYVEIDYRPLESGVRTRGFTFDVEYQYFNMGDKNARIVSCESLLSFEGSEGTTELFIGEGLRIACDSVSITGSGATTTSPHSEDLWTRVTFVVDPVLKVVFIYVDGIISSIRNLGETQTFITDSKIYLGCCLTSSGEPTGHCDCKIKNLRVYNRALSHEEVLQNYQSDMIVPDQIESVTRNLGNNLPELEIFGNYAGMSADVDVPMDLVRYQPKSGEGLSFELHGKCEMGWQGNSSLKYPVKNYDLTLVEDDGSEFKRQFKPDWMIRDSFHIKANMIDSSHSFNLGIAKFVSQLYTVKTPPMESDPLIRYAVDGFPVLLYENGKYSGLYTWNLHQHRNVFGLKKSNPDHIMYRAEENSAQGSVAFRYWGEEDTVAEDGSYIGGIKSEWEKRHPKPKDNPDNTELAKLIEWVATCDDEEFVREINAGRRFKKEFLIDYFIVAYTFAMVDSLGKNMTLTTWEKDENGNSIWYCMFYDMDTAFGFNNEGALVFPPDLTLTDKPGFNTSSYLWERVQKLFAKDIKERYREMRRTRMKIDTFINIMEEELIGRVGEKFMNLDVLTKYVPYGTNYTHMAKGKKYHHLRDWLKARFLLLDSEFDFTREDDNDQVIIRSDKLGALEFRIKTYSPQYITVDFGGNNVHTKLCTPNEYTVFTHNHDGSHKDLAISGASYITHLEGLENQNVSMLNVEFCKRLLSLKVGNNPLLRTLDVSTCERLTYLDCSNCTGLTGELNVNKCFSLKHLDCSNTKLDTVLFSSCSYLKYLNLDNTKVKKLAVANMTSIESVSLTNMEYLTDLEIKNCIHMRNLDASNSSTLVNLTITDCDNLYALDVTNNTRLSNLVIDYCPNVNSITLTNCTSLSILDLTNLRQLENLYAGGSGVEHITFSNQTWIKYFTTPKTTLKTVTGLRYRPKSLTGGFGGEQPEQFDNCRVLETFEDTIIDISHLDDRASNNGRWFFRNCHALTKLPERFICPNMTGFGDISYGGMFNSCRNLEDFNMVMDLENITSGINTFNGCTKLKTFSGGLNVPNLTDIRNFVANCSSLEELDLSMVNPNHITSAFINCSKLHTLKLGDTSTVLEWNHAFDGCSLIEDLSFLKIRGRVNLYSAFRNCTNLSKLPDLSQCTPYDMAWTFENCSSITGSITIDCSEMQTYTNHDNNGLCGAFRFATSLEEVHLLNTDHIKNYSKVFDGCSSIRNITGANITSNVVRAISTFYACADFDPSSLIVSTENLIEAHHMFKNSGLAGTIELDVRSLKNAPEMFRETKVQSVTLNNTGSIVDARSIFYGCSELTYVSPIKGDSMTGVSSAFVLCPNLKVVDISLPLITSFHGMFDNCNGIEEIYLRETVNVTNMQFMCRNLTTLKKVNINKLPYVDTLLEAFRGCTNLTDVTLGELPNATNLNLTFDGTNITKVPECVLNAPKITHLNHTFRNCTNLSGDVVINNPALTEVFQAFMNTGINSLKIDDSLRITNFNNVACDCPNITRLELNAQYITTSNNFQNVATNCPKLTTVVVKNIGKSTTNDFQWASGIRSLPVLSSLTFPECTCTINASNNPKLSAEAINELFRSLGRVSGKSIHIGGCEGTKSCDRSIATAKGWTVTETVQG